MLILISGPLWMIPLPESLASGWLGSLKYAVQVLQCHMGLLLLPCAYFLLQALLRQKRWIERVKLIVLIAVCLCVSWGSMRSLLDLARMFRIAHGVLSWLIVAFRLSARSA